jgi:hypothetical protein
VFVVGCLKYIDGCVPYVAHPAIVRSMYRILLSPASNRDRPLNCYQWIVVTTEREATHKNRDKNAKREVMVLKGGIDGPDEPVGKRPKRPRVRKTERHR